MTVSQATGLVNAAVKLHGTWWHTSGLTMTTSGLMPRTLPMCFFRSAACGAPSWRVSIPVQ